MVQEIRILLENKIDETSLKEVFSTFICSKDPDISSFLVNSAVRFEKERTSRTYLIIDENTKDKIKIKGFFSIALKTLELTSTLSNNQRKKILKCSNDDNIACYLIGQLGRDDSTDKGFGKELLETAISYIKAACNIVGGRLVYLDCKRELKDYYENAGFKYLQDNKENNQLIQMYVII